MKQSSGWMLTNLLRLKSSAIGKKRWKVCATPSSQSCTRLEVVCLEVCPVPQVVCLIWVVHLAVVPPVLDPVQDPPSRRLTKFTDLNYLNPSSSYPYSLNHVGSKVKKSFNVQL